MIRPDDGCLLSTFLVDFRELARGSLPIIRPRLSTEARDEDSYSLRPHTCSALGVSPPNSGRATNIPNENAR
jgi:hypothetical protein